MTDLNLKILYIVHISSKYTGANISLLNMLKGIKEKGVVPVVILPPFNDMSMQIELSVLGIKSYVLNYNMPIYPSFANLNDKIKFLPRLIRLKLQNIFATRRLKQICSTEKVEIIHSNVGPMLIGYEVAKALNLPHVWHLREFQDLDFNFPTFYSKLEFKNKLSSANNYPIAISESVFKHFDLKSPACLIYNGILSFSQTQYLNKKDRYFLFVGQLSESKGIYLLLNAFLKLVKVHPDFKLLIAGVSNNIHYFKKLHDFVLGNGIQNSVEFLGHRDDISTLMSRAYALIVPSFNEAFGRITAEAMFNGCFVIGNNSGGTQEIIDKIGTGILYNSDDDLIKAMIKVANGDEENLEEKLIYAMQEAARNFSDEKNAESVFKYYQEILTSRRGRTLFENSIL
jgi:glycosyltransferase involved in cell wall biosynthesis